MIYCWSGAWRHSSGATLLEDYAATGTAFRGIAVLPRS